MDSLETAPHFVDDYLGYLYEAAADGRHLRRRACARRPCSRIFSRAAIDRQLRELGGFARRLAAIRADGLAADERLDRAMLDADIHARLLEIERTRNHERNPQLYADTLATTLASQVVFDYAPVAERGRRLVSKLRQTPTLLTAARENVKDPPGLFVKTAVETLRGLLTFLDVDLPRALADLDDLSLLGDLADASTEASQAIGAYVEWLEKEVGPKAKGSFRLGQRALRRQAASRGGRRPAARPRCWRSPSASSARREEEFARVAAALGREAPAEAWQRLKGEHPPAGQLVAEARAQVEALRAFLERESALVSVPEHEPLRVAPTPPFYRWTFASLWCPGPFETRPVRAFYYLTDADPVLAGRPPGAAPARFQPADALVDLDARGVSGALPALPAPAARRLASPQEPDARADVSGRRLGALRRADDDRGRLRSGTGTRQTRSIGRIAGPARRA